MEERRQSAFSDEKKIEANISFTLNLALIESCVECCLDVFRSQVFHHP